ncbi:MAG: hypothetical protein K0U93_08610 [Gammaproteobacteria bacterium]|nr:hypothetical protein [Gammaproteobacteria bacterium]
MQRALALIVASQLFVAAADAREARITDALNTSSLAQYLPSWAEPCGVIADCRTPAMGHHWPSTVSKTKLDADLTVSGNCIAPLRCEKSTAAEAVAPRQVTTASSAESSTQRHERAADARGTRASIAAIFLWRLFGQRQ